MLTRRGIGVRVLGGIGVAMLWFRRRASSCGFVCGGRGLESYLGVGSEIGGALEQVLLLARGVFGAGLVAVEALHRHAFGFAYVWSAITARLAEGSM